MASFLEKLKNNRGDEVSVTNEKEEELPSGTSQLDVDVFQADYEVIITAQVPGSGPTDFDVFVEGDSDILTITGKKQAPEAWAGVHIKEQTGAPGNTGEEEDSNVEVGRYIVQENKWGSFYRRVVLPQEVNISGVEARVERGVLIIRLPFVKAASGKRAKIKVLGSTNRGEVKEEQNPQ